MDSGSGGSPQAKRLKLLTTDNMPGEAVNIETILPDCLIKPMIYEPGFIATLSDKRLLSAFIQEINKTFPLPAFQHLKRVRNGDVFLFPVSLLVPGDPDRYSDRVKQLLLRHNFPESLIGICSNIRIEEVPLIAPQLKSQYNEAIQFWPCKFHEDKELEKLTRNELLAPKEILYHCQLMQICYDLRSLLGSKCLTMVFDSSRKTIVSLGWTQSLDNDDLSRVIPSNHSVMRALDNVALAQGGGAWSSSQDKELLERGLKLANFLFKAYEDWQLFSTEPLKHGPYLCTGFDFYMIEEPCLMCSMAMVHSRVRRIFFHKNNVANGAVGGGNQLKLHSVKELNHHYQVFRVNKEISES